MLRFMDGSVVAMGCLLVLGSLLSRWWGRTRAGKGEATDRNQRFLRAWIPLLIGLGMIGARVPAMLHAPHSVTKVIDALDLALAVTALVLVLRTGRRSARARNTG